MPKSSPVSAAFHDAFAFSFRPLLDRIGFRPSKPRNVKPGLVVALASRALADGKRLEVCLWCEGKAGDLLRLRVGVVGLLQEVECSTQIDLKVPWSDASAPHAASLDFSAKEFLPHRGTEQLRKAIAFLAGAFAASFEELALAVPELASELRTAGNESTWMAAGDLARELWRTRHMRGEVDERSLPASIVFVGANLVTVTADGERFTFRFDTRDFDRTAPISVSGWFLTPASTRRATRLTAGQRTWHFDQSGMLTHVSGAGTP